MRPIVLTSPSSILTFILLVMGLQTGLLGYEQVSEVRLSADASPHRPGLCSATGSRIGNNIEANSISETRDAGNGPHPMELAPDTKNNLAGNKRGGYLRATHVPRFQSITVSWLMKTWQRIWGYRPAAETPATEMPAAETQEIKEIMQRHMALSQKIQTFEKDFAKMYKGHFHKDKLKEHVSNWRLIAGHQYARKVDQLRTYGRYRIMHGEEGLPGEVFDKIYGRVATEYFAAFDDVVRKGIDYHVPGVKDLAKLMMARWSDLMLDFFLDLKELDMLPSRLYSASERNFETVQFVASYLLGKFPPFDVASTYLNLDLRTSILEDANNHKLKDLCHQFDEATWKELEFQFLKARLEHEVAAGVPPQGFQPIMTGFIQGGQLPDGGSEMGNLFQDIISYLPKAELNGGEEKLVHFKLLYDMLRFIYRYNSHPERIISGLEGQETLLQLYTFEECIRFISSLNHFDYEVSKLFLLNLRHEDSLLEQPGHHLSNIVHDGITTQQLTLPDKIREKLMGSNYLTAAYKHPKEPQPSSFGKPPQDTSQEIDAPLMSAILSEKESFHSTMSFTYMHVYFFQKGGELGVRLKQDTEAQHTRYLIQAYKLTQISSPSGFPRSDFHNLFDSLKSAAINHAKLSVKLFAHTISPYQQFFDLTLEQRNHLFHFISFPHYP